MRILFLGLLLFSVSVFGQNKTKPLTGLVIDSLYKKGVPYASVAYRGDKEVLAMTDTDGFFTIPRDRIDTAFKLIISAIGYQAKTLYYKTVDSLKVFLQRGTDPNLILDHPGLPIFDNSPPISTPIK